MYDTKFWVTIGIAVVIALGVTAYLNRRDVLRKRREDAIAASVVDEVLNAVSD